jgi:hypothetical protein
VLREPQDAVQLSMPIIPTDVAEASNMPVIHTPCPSEGSGERIYSNATCPSEGSGERIYPNHVAFSDNFQEAPSSGLQVACPDTNMDGDVALVDKK